MDMIIVSILLLALVICAAAYSECKPRRKSTRKAQKGDSKQNEESFKQAIKDRERAREEHYMRNFWNYDGSEQLDYDEEV